MKYLNLILLIAAVSAFTSCSYLTDFAVINESDQAIEVKYKVKNYPGPFGPPVDLATIQTSQLSPKGRQAWIKLTPSQYQLDEENRTVLIKVMPGQSLRVVTMHHYVGHEDATEAANYPIAEISVIGARGELKEAGERARTSFSKVSRALYTFTYE